MRKLLRTKPLAFLLPLLAALAISSCDVEDEPYGGYDSLSGIDRKSVV